MFVLCFFVGLILFQKGIWGDKDKIAQEVEAVLPEAVHTSPDGQKSVAYYQLVPVLIEAVKSINSEVEELKAEVAALQKQLSQAEKK